MRIIFFGSDDFAAVHLSALLKVPELQVAACVTQPDRAQGRGMQLLQSPIKQMAIRQGIPCLQPVSLTQEAVLDQLKSVQPDLMVVVSYGRLLPPAVLALPKIFCINVHGSLLPKYRGAAPIHWAIIHGEQMTGVTVQRMVTELDAGDVIAQTSLSITETTRADQLREQMSYLGASLLVKTIASIGANTYSLIPQDPSLVTYAPKLTKDLGRVIWDEPAVTIERKVRGLYPWPGTRAMYEGKEVKIHAARLGEGQGLPGQVIVVGHEGLVVACGQGALCLTQVQPAAGKVMDALSFARGYRVQEGKFLT